MTAKRRRDDLDKLIAEIIVDCYDEDEELMGFENAFDEGADFPVPDALSAKTSECYPSPPTTADES